MRVIIIKLLILNSAEYLKQGRRAFGRVRVYISRVCVDYSRPCDYYNVYIVLYTYLNKCNWFVQKHKSHKSALLSVNIDNTYQSQRNKGQS